MSAAASVPEVELDLVVEKIDTPAPDVRSLSLRAPAGTELPAWEPGAHVDLHCGEHVRQYSLCGDPADRSCWQVAVLREPAGRGGSAHVHDALSEGSVVRVRGPRNHFPLEPAPRYRFVAGGIGITPLLPMIAAAEQAGATWTLAYGGRTRGSMAFAQELAATYGDRVLLQPQDEVGLLDLDALLAAPREDELVYCCGPESLLAAVEERCASWPAGTLHVERFSPKAQGERIRATDFEVELAGSGLTLTVPPDKSVLQVLEEAGVDILSSCTEGTCGTCETGVLAGEVDHRDSLLTEEERAANDVMFVCVSRAACPKLVLEL